MQDSATSALFSGYYGKCYSQERRSRTDIDVTTCNLFNQKFDHFLARVSMSLYDKDVSRICQAWIFQCSSDQIFIIFIQIYQDIVYIKISIFPPLFPAKDKQDSKIKIKFRELELRHLYRLKSHNRCVTLRAMQRKRFKYGPSLFFSLHLKILKFIVRECMCYQTSGMSTSIFVKGCF